MERLADENRDRATRRFIVSDDPDEVVDRIAPYVELGFDELVFHAPGDDQARFLEQFAARRAAAAARRLLGGPKPWPRPPHPHRPRSTPPTSCASTRCWTTRRS